jgi:serine/threonine-protein kinase
VAAASGNFGNYFVLSLLGRGGMAEVYRARAVTGPRAGWPVAIKRLLPQFAERPESIDLFTSEADLTRLLDHPNIVRVYEVGALRDTYFIAMELVDGRDLGQILAKCHEKKIHLPVDFSLFLIHTLLDALAYAPAAVDKNGKPLGIVHRDVSPSNLFISRTGEIKLGDFGVAQAPTTVTEGTVPGKPHYLSPDTLAGTSSVETDLWAANVMLYELLTLERPFDGKTPKAIFEAAKKRKYVPLDEMRQDLPDAVYAIVDRGFAKDATLRFATAAEMRDTLAPHFDPNVGTPLAIAAVVRMLFGATEG